MFLLLLFAVAFAERNQTINDSVLLEVSGFRNFIEVNSHKDTAEESSKQPFTSSLKIAVDIELPLDLAHREQPGIEPTFIFIGIAGPPAVGKTTLAKKIAEELQSPVKAISEDWYIKQHYGPCVKTFRGTSSNGLRIKDYAEIQCPDYMNSSGLKKDLCSIRSQLKAAAISTGKVPNSVRVEFTESTQSTWRRTELVENQAAGKTFGSLCSGDIGQPTVYIVVEGFKLFLDMDLLKMMDFKIWLAYNNWEILADRALSRRVRVASVCRSGEMSCQDEDFLSTFATQAVPDRFHVSLAQDRKLILDYRHWYEANIFKYWKMSEATQLRNAGSDVIYVDSTKDDGDVFHEAIDALSKEHVLCRKYMSNIE